ncbi:MAG: hypothetical protein P1Q69_11490 [Candidatus Thorarchaeota archaeon]|nr:hypothetical protein [Candidatus Thorarchaeota archaeon]
MRVYLVDTGALLTNWVQKNPDARFVAPSSVIEEIRNRPSIQRVESLISLDRLSIEDAQEHCIREAQKAATETGDISVLSTQDIDLLGLAFRRSRNGDEVTVVSTDIAVLNVARFIGVKILDPRGKISHDVQWMMKCPACGNSTKNTKLVECEVCGTKMKRRSVSRRKIK